MKVSSVNNCSFDKWYPLFHNFTTKSLVLRIPRDVIEYLLADNVSLPNGVERPMTINCQDEEEDSDSNDWCDDATAPEISATCSQSFKDFNSQLVSAISELGGKVFPKLNWHSPKDASWIAANKTLECICLEDIYLLLKSSDDIVSDLTSPYETCDDLDQNNKPALELCLVLREWRDINPASEYRCFVRNRQLLAICRRYFSEHQPYTETEVESIVSGITAFYASNILQRFPEQSYVFDLFQDKQDQWILLDFSPFGSPIDAIAYEWDELDQPHDQAPIFRTTNRATVSSRSGMPSDLTELLVHNTAGESLIETLRKRVEDQKNNGAISD